MARDHRKLRVFHDAHELVLAIYRETKDFPREEWYGLRAQIRRAATSIPTNVVEGNARRSTRDYLKFLNIARGSASEVAYLVDLSFELGYLARLVHRGLSRRCDSLIPQLEALIRTMETSLQEEVSARRRQREQEKRKKRSARTKD